VLGAPSSPYRGAQAAGLLERGFHRGALAWLTPSLGTVDSLQPINAAPPDLRDEMCGPRRKRPPAREADDDSTTAETGSDTPNGFMLSSLPPSSEKPSALLSPRPASVNPIVVYVGPSKKPAESQFAAARARLAKAAKNSAKNPATKTNKTAKQTEIAATAPSTSEALKRDPHTAPVPLPPTAPSATASIAADQPAKDAAKSAAKDAVRSVARSAAAQSSQTAPAPPPGAFAPPPNKFTRSARALSTATDLDNPPWMSFAPTPRADGTPAPLTAMPNAKPDLQVASVPIPRPRPKIVIKRKKRRR